MKILIADDEELARITLISLLAEVQLPDYTIIEAEDGLSLIKKVQAEAPDIAFVDIKMPYLNGLQAIKEVQRNAENTEWIILSGYQDFEFAKEAIALGVHDYLLKPLSKKTFVQVMKKVLLKHAERIISEKKQFERDCIAMIHEQAFTLPKGYTYFKIRLVKEVFLYPVESDPVCNSLALHYQSHIQTVLDNSNCIGDFLLEPHVFLHIECWKYGSSVAISNGRVFEEYLEERKKSFLENILNEPIIFAVSGYVSENPKAMIEQLNKMKELLMRIPAIPPWENNDLNTMYHINSNILFTANAAKAIVKTLDGSDIFGFKKCLNILKEYAAQSEFDGKAAQAIILFIKMHVLLQQIDKNTMSFTTAKTQQSADSESFKNFLDFLEEEFHQKTLSLSSSDQYVSSVIRYVDEHFKEDFGIATLAEQLDITPNYLGRLIFEQTGKRLSELIAIKRINLAKELLMNTDKKIQDITVLCGYQSTRYFTKIFNKHMKMNPSEFRNFCL